MNTTLQSVNEVIFIFGDNLFESASFYLYKFLVNTKNIDG